MGLSKDRRDIYYRSAKAQGYRARSAYKLIQIDEEFEILRDVKRAVDLCSCPGGWSQVLVERMHGHTSGSSAEDESKDRQIVAVDLFEMSAIPGVHFIKGDITHVTTAEQIIDCFRGERADLVVSDGAPDVLGLHDFDEYVQHQLVLAALNISTHILADGGTFIAKIFRGRGINAMYTLLSEFFTSVCISKPRACRNSSIEGFVVCKGYQKPENFVPDMNQPLLLDRDTLAAPPANVPFQACGSSVLDADRSYPMSYVLSTAADGGGDVEPTSTSVQASAPPINPPYKEALRLKRKN